jgi:hypothetical protein
MRRPILVAALVILALFAPAPVFAWGAAGHRLIMGRAIELLPPDLNPFFQKFRDEVVLRVNDPDLWRNVGWEEDPHHFVDFGMPELGAYPFTNLPHDLSAAIEKFGMPTMKKIGLLPWREAEMYGNLRRGFEGFRRQAPYAASDVVLFTAVASHYIQDAHQPLHATNNYDGQLTGNVGIHARFERDLIERFASRLTLTPAAPKVILSPVADSFDVLLEGHKLVDGILKADSEAAAGKDVYDDDYFEKLFVKVKPLLERRLSESISATVGIIVGAWEAAGKPRIALADARPVMKVRKPIH